MIQFPVRDRRERNISQVAFERAGDVCVGGKEERKRKAYSIRRRRRCQMREEGGKGGTGSSYYVFRSLEVQ